MPTTLLLISVKDNPYCDKLLFESLERAYNKKGEIIVLFVDEPQKYNLQAENPKKDLTQLETEALHLGDESWKRNEPVLFDFVKHKTNQTSMTLIGNTTDEKIKYLNTQARLNNLSFVIYRWKDWLTICDPENRIEKEFNEYYVINKILQEGFEQTAKNYAHRKSQKNPHDPGYQKYYEAAMKFLKAELPYLFLGKKNITEIIYAGEKSKASKALCKLPFDNNKKEIPYWFNLKENAKKMKKDNNPIDNNYKTPRLPKIKAITLHIYNQLNTDDATTSLIAGIFNGLKDYPSNIKIALLRDIIHELSESYLLQKNKKNPDKTEANRSESKIPKYYQTIFFLPKKNEKPGVCWMEKVKPTHVFSTCPIPKENKTVSKNIKNFSAVIVSLFNSHQTNIKIATLIAVGIASGLCNYAKSDSQKVIPLMDKLLRELNKFIIPIAPENKNEFSAIKPSKSEEIPSIPYYYRPQI